jgi:RecA/RadA recombinase
MVAKHQFETADKLISSGIHDIVTIRQATGLTGSEVEDLIANYQQYKKQYQTQTQAASNKKINWLAAIKQKLT